MKSLEFFKETHLPSKEYLLGFINIVAIACHEIGVQVYRRANGGLRPLEPLGPPLKVPIIGLRPSVFAYAGYSNAKDYPNGVADCAGYWTEFQLLGGVILFDHGGSNEEASIYIYDLPFIVP
jgi:hypothetical protein